jgi:hypothetical protein
MLVVDEFEVIEKRSDEARALDSEILQLENN